ERIDHQPGIIRESRQAGGKRCGLRLETRIRRERDAGFLRLGQLQLGRGNCLDAMAREQIAHLGELALVMRGDDEAAGNLPVHHITASFCRSTSLPMPLRASASSADNCSSLNAIFSAVACTSTRLPAPVMTKFASVSASESSE